MDSITGTAAVVEMLALLNKGTPDWILEKARQSLHDSGLHEAGFKSFVFFELKAHIDNPELPGRHIANLIRVCWEAGRHFEDLAGQIRSFTETTLADRC